MPTAKPKTPRPRQRPKQTQIGTTKDTAKSPKKRTPYKPTKTSLSFGGLATLGWVLAILLGVGVYSQSQINKALKQEIADLNRRQQLAFGALQDLQNQQRLNKISLSDTADNENLDNADTADEVVRPIVVDRPYVFGKKDSTPADDEIADSDSPDP